MKYILIGPYPPPLGGISVFIYRYAKLLRSQGVDVECVDFSKLSKSVKILKFIEWICSPTPTCFHLNGFNFNIMQILLFRPFPKQFNLHDHSGRKVLSLSSKEKVILGKFLASTSKAVVVGRHILDYYNKAGLVLPENTEVKHAYIPPPIEDEPSIWQSYEQTTLDFIKSHKPMIIANAFRIEFYEGIDLYGLDMCIELLYRLKADFNDIGIVFALAGIGNYEYYEQCLLKIRDLEIEDNFHFMTGQKELWPLFKQADLMVRPTFNDGYGISIAEAIDMGCPALASDVCERPEGTIIFKNRSIDSLVLLAHNILSISENNK